MNLLDFVWVGLHCRASVCAIGNYVADYYHHTTLLAQIKWGLTSCFPVSSFLTIPLLTTFSPPGHYSEIWWGLDLPSWNFNKHWSLWLQEILLRKRGIEISEANAEGGMGHICSLIYCQWCSIHISIEVSANRFVLTAYRRFIDLTLSLWTLVDSICFGSRSKSMSLKQFPNSLQIH